MYPHLPGRETPYAKKHVDDDTQTMPGSPTIDWRSVPLLLKHLRVFLLLLISAPHPNQHLTEKWPAMNQSFE
jgi:hypothetical protein